MSTSMIIECYSCHKSTIEQDAHQIRLLLPTGQFRNGVELLHASATLYECDSCVEAEFEASGEPVHLYTAHSCGITRTVGTATPEDAAALLMKDRGWASTRSIAVIGSGVQCEFLDCELVDGQLQYSEQVNWH